MEAAKKGLELSRSRCNFIYGYKSGEFQKADDLAYGLDYPLCDCLCNGNQPDLWCAADDGGTIHTTAAYI